MSCLVDGALAAAGLLWVDQARERGELGRLRDAASSLEAADLLLVGSLADRARARECGDVVRVFANVAAEACPDVVVVSSVEGERDGQRFLRRVALARLLGPTAARVRVDWSESGFEIAQVAVSFGASELAGPIASRRGLLIADDATVKVKGRGMTAVATLKKQEIEGLLAAAGRRVVFVPPTRSEATGAHV